jgi:serine/threonine-protein kinase ULK/ATG1
MSNDIITLKKYSYYKKKIGNGSYSKVYKGFSNIDGNTYAIKKINKIKIPKYVLKEIEITKKLNHNNVIKLYDMMEIDKYIYLIIDYCRYRDLKTYLTNKKTSEKIVHFYMKQISNGLLYLFENNIFHRDLKPQNILLNGKNIIKITDFGFSNYFKSEDEMSKTICGTPLYMAPEMLKYKQYTINADLWSVGVVLYELLFKSLPFIARTPHQLLEQIEKAKYPLDFTHKKTSIECAELLSSLLQNNPKKRINWNDFFNHVWFDKDFNENINISKKQFVKSNNINIISKNNNISKKFENIKFNSAPSSDTLPKELTISNNSKSHLIFKENHFSPPTDFMNFEDFILL